MWNTFKAVQLFLLALVFAGWVARYLPPDIFWWVALMAIFLPFTTLALIPGLIFSVIGRQWLWALLSLSGLFLGGLRVFFLPAFPQASPASARSLRVMSYNYQPRSGSIPPGREGLLQLVRGQHPDVIAFQEAEYWYRPQGNVATVGIQELIDSLGYRVVRPEGVKKEYEQPVLVASAVRVLSARQYRFAYDSKDKASAIITRVEMVWEGRRLAFYNIHLRSFGPDKPWRENERCWLRPACWMKYLRMYRDAYRKRAFEVRQIRRLIHADPLPVIVAGDLNSTPYNWSYAQIRGSLIDVYAHAGRWPGFTYHSKQPFVRIDVILADPSFEAVRASVIRVKYSDHLPLLGDVRWRVSP